MAIIIRLVEIYPFNLACEILGSEEEALKIYVPGVWEALETLPEREKDIIKRRYDDKMTLKDVGELYNIGGERVRQLEALAIRKLRHTTRRGMIMGVQRLELDRTLEEYNKLLDKYEIISSKYELHNIDNNRDRIMDAMKISINDLGLTVRSRNGLARAGKRTLGDISRMTKREIEYTRNLGVKSVEEIIRKVHKYGLTLMDE